MALNKTQEKAVGLNHQNTTFKLHLRTKMFFWGITYISMRKKHLKYTPTNLKKKVSFKEFYSLKQKFYKPELNL